MIFSVGCTNNKQEKGAQFNPEPFFCAKYLNVYNILKILMYLSGATLAWLVLIGNQ
jgi:hypothetical protein